MPYVETIRDLVDWLADGFAVYGAHDETCIKQRPCRVCWTSDMEDRMRQALTNERRLAAPLAAPADGATGGETR